MTKVLEERPYQTAVHTRIMDAYDEGLESVMVVSPTGSGKTVMGLMAAKAIQAGDETVGVAWIAMRRTLLDQAADENRAVGVKNLILISAFESNPEERLAGFEKTILVLDEAHHSAADTCVAMWDIVNPVFTIGLSATPQRTDNLKLCFQRVIQEAGYHRLIQDGYLASYAHWILNHYTPKSVAEAYLAQPEQWGRTAIFFRTAEECYECCDLLFLGGAKVAVVTATTDREQQLEDFESGKLDVLINMMVLSEGWDCPSLRTVFVRDSEKGPTIQMAGRVLRKWAAYALKNIVQSGGTNWNFGRTALPKISYTQSGDSWLSLTPNTALLLEAIKAADARMLAQANSFNLDPTSTRFLSALHNKAARAKRAKKLSSTSTATAEASTDPDDFILGTTPPPKAAPKAPRAPKRAIGTVPVEEVVSRAA